VTLSHARAPFEDDVHTELPTSELLIRIVENCPEGEVSVGDLVDRLGDRAFAILLLILALPVSIPGPPGIPNIFGTPMLVFSAQLWLGHQHPWLPGFIRRRRFSRDALLALLRRARPVLARLERVCRPRMLALTDRRGERWLGAFICFCAIVLMNPVPIPFSHLPLGMALAILSLGYVERDGIVLIAGMVAAVLGVILNLSLTGSFLLLGLKFLRHLVS